MGIQSIDVTQESTGRRVPKLVSEGSQIVSKLVSKGEQLDFRQQGIQIMNVNCERWGNGGDGCSIHDFRRGAAFLDGTFEGTQI